MYFRYTTPPQIQPVEMTLDKGASLATRLGHWWRASKRLWVFCRDWYYELDGEPYMIPEGFEFDGASSPKILHSICNPMGILLYAAIVHDFGYRYSTLLKVTREPSGILTRYDVDLIFYRINLEMNQLCILSYLTYLTVRCGGYFIWKKHRRNEHKLLPRASTDKAPSESKVF